MPRRLAALLLSAGLLCVLAPADAAALAFGELPALPTLPTVTLNAGAQTVHATMTGFSVVETAGESTGWNLTVAGLAGSGKSAVFAQYCGKTTCGTDAKGYVTGGATLAAGSLTLSTTGASLTGGSGTASFKCTVAACKVDAASAEKVVSRAAAASTGGTWKASAFSATSLSLNTKSTLKALKNEEIYRVDILWTLSTGP